MDNKPGPAPCDTESCALFRIATHVLAKAVASFSDYRNPDEVFLYGPTIDGVGIPESFYHYTEHGSEWLRPDLLLVGHVHCWTGVLAAHPSVIDIRILREIQKSSGLPVAGLICTPDNYIGFFTGGRPLHVEIIGDGVERVAQDVYRLMNTTPDQDENSRINSLDLNLTGKPQNQDSNPAQKRQIFDDSLTLCHFHATYFKRFHRRCGWLLIDVTNGSATN